MLNYEKTNLVLHKSHNYLKITILYVRESIFFFNRLKINQPLKIPFLVNTPKKHCQKMTPFQYIIITSIGIFSREYDKINNRLVLMYYT